MWQILAFYGSLLFLICSSLHIPAYSPTHPSKLNVEALSPAGKLSCLSVSPSQTTWVAFPLDPIAPVPSCVIAGIVPTCQPPSLYCKLFRVIVGDWFALRITHFMCPCLHSFGRIPSTLGLDYVSSFGQWNGTNLISAEAWTCLCILSFLDSCYHMQIRLGLPDGGREITSSRTKSSSPKPF